MKLLDIYKSFNKELKVNFWVITTNIILVMFTAWLGFTVQDIIVSKNAMIQRDILQYDYGEKLYPAYEAIYTNNGYIINSLGAIAYDSTTTYEQKVQKMNSFIQNNHSQLLNMADTVVTTLGKLRFYVNKKYYKDIEDNNATLLVTSLMISELDSIESNHDYKVNKNLISQLVNSNKFFINCGTNKANRAQLDNIWNQLIDNINPYSIKSAKSLIYAQFNIALIQNLQVFTDIIEGNSDNSVYSKILNNPFYLLLFTFIAIIITIHLITRFMAPKSLERTYSYDEYHKLNQEKKNISELVKNRENTIHRLEVLIKEQQSIIDKLNHDVD